MKSCYKLGDVVLPYCFSKENSAFNNERKVEVPLAKYVINKFKQNTIEVGSVTCHYGCDNHIILDLTEKHPKVINENALYFDYRGKNVVTISTIEHFMQREYGNGSNQDAITFIEKVVNEAANYLIEFPLCYNEFLDEYIKQGKHKILILKRISADNQWEQEKDTSNLNYPFGHRDGRFPDGVFNNANAVGVITNFKEFHG